MKKKREVACPMSLCKISTNWPKNLFWDMGLPSVDCLKTKLPGLRANRSKQTSWTIFWQISNFDFIPNITNKTSQAYFVGFGGFLMRSLSKIFLICQCHYFGKSGVNLQKEILKVQLLNLLRKWTLHLNKSPSLQS